jgi:hypothetical protein
MSNGNVFVFSFSQLGFEAIVNLTLIDEAYVLAKMGDEITGRSVHDIIYMMEMRARFNPQRKMEVWLVKLSEEFTQEELLDWADEDPQAVADMARMGKSVFGGGVKHERRVIE